MALKSERSRIRFKDIESVPPLETTYRAGRPVPIPERPANEEWRMSVHPLSVGEELRRAREAAGLELADVAAHLRIRGNFLSALEEGRPDALPGITYAIGYVRTYAAFLGLEPDGAVRRFKEEAAGLNSKTQLVFPSPAPEGRVPGLVLMFVAALLAGGAYGGWYWLSERDGSLRDLVPAVPERLAQLIEGEAPPLPAVTAEPRPAAGTAGSYAEANPAGVTLARPEAATNPIAGPVPAGGAPVSGTPSGGTPVGVTSPERPAETVPASPPAPAASTPPAVARPALPPQGTVAQRPTAQVPDGTVAAGSRPVAAPPVSRQPETPVAAAEAPAAAPAAAPQAGASTQATASPGAMPQASADAAPASGSPDVTAPPEPTASNLATAAVQGTGGATAPAHGTHMTDGSDVPAAPRIAGLIGASEAAVPAGRTAAGPLDRVMIRATGDSWVQVRDAQGTALFTRVLREGDVYRVPDQAGLRLATGNAGALQILVDGTPAPSLGDFGQVVRNVLLGPSRLAAGTAISGSR